MWSALSSMAKSSPQSVLVRLQESLHRGNFTPVEYFYKGSTKAPTGAGHTLSRASFAISPPTWLHFFFKSEDTAFTVHCPHHTTGHSLYSTIYIIGHSLYSLPSHKSVHIYIHITWMGPLSFRIFTLSKWCVTHCPSMSLSKDIAKSPRGARTTLCPRVAKAKLPRFPFALPKLLTQVNQLHLSI